MAYEIKDYTLGSYGGRVQKGKCFRCGERKPTRNEPGLGRGVRLCRPCLVKNTREAHAAENHRLSLRATESVDIDPFARF